MPVIGFESQAGDWVSTDVEHLTADQENELLSLAKPETRPSLVAAFLELDARQRRWLAVATPAQRAIGWGGYAVTRWDGEGGNALSPGPCTIYGALMTRRQFIAAERNAMASLGGVGTVSLNFGGGGIDLPVRDPEQTVAEMDAAYDMGWRYGRWWSKAEPVDGDPGEHHIANLTPITAKQFRRARLAGWPEEVPQP